MLHRESTRGFLTLAAIAVFLGLLALSILPEGAGFWELVTVAAAYTIASAIGVWAVFVPSGIGVREGAFVAILSALGFSVEIGRAHV